MSEQRLHFLPQRIVVRAGRRHEGCALVTRAV
jgi:hypothetical protein